MKKQRIGVALSYTPAFSSTLAPADGVFGMGFSSISQYNTIPLLQALSKTNQIPASVFSLKLAPQGSELTLGGVNDEYFTGGFTYVPTETEVRLFSIFEICLK